MPHSDRPLTIAMPPPRRRARIAAIAAAVLGAGLVFAAAPAASAADPAPITVDSVGSYNGYVGLNATTTFMLRNTTAEPITDITLRLTPMSDRTGITLPSSTEISYNPKCTQPDGAGTDILCSGYSLAAKGSVGINAAPVFPRDYFLNLPGDPPFSLTATLSSPTTDLSAVAPYVHTTPLLSSIALKTAVRVYDTPTASGPTVPTNGSYSVVAPSQKSLQILVTHGGFSDIRNLTAHLEIPSELTLGELPSTCLANDARTAVDCTWAVAKAGYYTQFMIPVTVKAGTPVGTHIPLVPTVTVSSPNEPAGQKNSWTAAHVNGPYEMVVSGTVASVDLSAAIDQPDTLASGSVATFPVALANAGDFDAATGVHAEFTVDGIPATDLATTLPGCAASGSMIVCDFDEVPAGWTAGGNISLRLPHEATGTTFTIAGSITSVEVDNDPANNTVSREFTIAEPDAGPLDPEEPGTDTDTDGDTDTDAPAADAEKPLPGGSVDPAVDGTRLASTGSDTALWAVVTGLGLLAAGTVALTARRRVRNARR